MDDAEMLFKQLSDNYDCVKRHLLWMD